MPNPNPPPRSPSSPFGENSQTPGSSHGPPAKNAPGAVGQGLPEGSAPRLAEAILQLAKAIEFQEQRIKQTLLEAASRGNTDLVKALLEAWIQGPVSEVLARPE